MILNVPTAHARNKALLLHDIRKYMAERYNQFVDGETSLRIDVFLTNTSRCYVVVSKPKLEYSKYGRMQFTEEVHTDAYDLIPGAGGVGLA